MQIPTTVTGAATVEGHAEATLPGAMYPSKLLRISLAGPAGSRVEIYVAGMIRERNARGQSNTLDFSTPLELPYGTPVAVRWPAQAVNAGQCTATFTVER